MTRPSSPPLACSLGAPDYAARLALIETLHRTHLRASSLRGRVLTLHYDAEVASQVRDLVRLEQACCQFLRFEIVCGHGEIVLRIEAPASAGERAEDLLSPFLVTPSAR